MSGAIALALEAKYAIIMKTHGVSKALHVGVCCMGGGGGGRLKLLSIH